MEPVSPQKSNPHAVVDPADYERLCRYFSLQAGAKLLPQDMTLTETFFRHGIRASGLLMRRRFDDVVEPVLSLAVLTPKVWSCLINSVLFGREPENTFEFFDQSPLFSDERRANILAGLLLLIGGRDNVASVARVIPEECRTDGYKAIALQRGDVHMAEVIGHSMALKPKMVIG